VPKTVPFPVQAYQHGRRPSARRQLTDITPHQHGGRGEQTDQVLPPARELAARLAAMSARIQASHGTVRAADLIERVATTGQPVMR